MEDAHGKQESEVAYVIKVAREPAVIINGVPDLPPDCTLGSQPEVKDDTESQVDPLFGELLEGRKVRKLFGDTYYVGKVAKYDVESNWYNVIYDDGDQEDLEWLELEKVLLPLDITVPLKTLMDKRRLHQTVTDHRSRVGGPRKVYAAIDGNSNKTSNMVPISQGNDANSQMVGVEGQGQQSNSERGLLEASTANHATSGQLVPVTAEGSAQAFLQASNQPRKRGRPRKDATVPADRQPKKRGRPPKSRNPPVEENNPDSLALVPVQDDMQKSCTNQNSILQRYTQTARAEKLKRDSLRVQGRPSGTQ